MNYYISDMHFGHGNILKLCGRPFESTEEMDETIIKNWNERVSKNDDVYILGDVGWKLEHTLEILRRLKGKKHLIAGNHDFRLLKNERFRNEFSDIHDLLEVKDKGCSDQTERIILCHYPLVEWNGFYRGAWHFYGHIHNNENDAQNIMKNIERAVNVGADLIGFNPRTAKELMSDSIASVK